MAKPNFGSFELADKDDPEHDLRLRVEEGGFVRSRVLPKPNFVEFLFVVIIEQRLRVEDDGVMRSRVLPKPDFVEHLFVVIIDHVP